MWYLLYHIPLVNVSLPRRLPDLDGDGVLDLVAACAVTLPSEVNDQVTLPNVGGSPGVVVMGGGSYSKKSWVQIPPPYTGWTIFHIYLL